jgi:hypothetical protein
MRQRAPQGGEAEAEEAAFLSEGRVRLLVRQVGENLLSLDIEP